MKFGFGVEIVVGLPVVANVSVLYMVEVTVGISTTDIATYTSVIQPDGTIYGEGQGIVRSTDNSEIALWRGSGVGHFSDDGGVSYRGAIYYQSQTPGFARLNGIAAMFEYSVDASGKTESTLTEWK